MRLFTRQNTAHFIKLVSALPVAALAISGAFFPAPLQSVDAAVRAEGIVLAAGKDVPFVPSPDHIVDQMLALAQVSKEDTVYDLGCGDGRIVVAAAKLGARGVGIDIDPQRISESNRRAQRENVSSKVKFIRQDFFEADISEASVVTLYLLPSVNMKLRPKLLKGLRPGTRVVSFSFSMGDWEPDKMSGMVLYWVVPADFSGQWKWVCPRSGEQMVLSLKQKFQNVKGTLSVGKQTYRIGSAAVSGNYLRFKTATKAPGTAAEYRCSLSDCLLNISTGPAGLGESVATRTPASESGIDGSDF